MALGVMEDLVFTPASMELKPGETLFLYTDGVNEAMDIDGNEYSYGRLEPFLEELAILPAKDIVDRVVDSVKAFAGKAPQSDDITLLVLRYMKK